MTHWRFSSSPERASERRVGNGDTQIDGGLIFLSSFLRKMAVEQPLGLR